LRALQYLTKWAKKRHGSRQLPSEFLVGRRSLVQATQDALLGANGYFGSKGIRDEAG
jgi:hypothetical protein